MGELPLEMQAKLLRVIQDGEFYRVGGTKPVKCNVRILAATNRNLLEMVESKTMGDWRVHNGVDFGGSAGNDVGAVADGKITKVYDDVFWGTVVEIDHGNGMTARYCGMKNATCLPEGTQVVKGEKIGTLGHIPVEISDEDHLHLEILIVGKTVDPLKAMNKIRNP